MKRILCVMLFISSGLFLFAQESAKEVDKEKLKEKIKAYKISYLTDKLDLTPEEAAAFWPVYNDFDANMQKMRMEMMGGASHKPDIENMSDAEIEEMMENQFSSQQQVLDLKKKYHARFLEVLSTEKVAILYEAEMAFRKKMIEEIGSKKPAEK